MKPCLPESLFNKFTSLQNANIVKRDPGTDFTCKFCETVKNTSFVEHLRTTASENT